MQMEFPPFIYCYAEFIGKSVSDFSPDDWRNAAINSGEILEQHWQRDNPPPKRRGRPRENPKPGTLGYLVKFGRWDKPSRKIGRRRQVYGTKSPLSANSIAEILDEVMSPEAQKHFQDAPKTETEAARMLAKSIGYPAGQVETMLRAARRARADKFMK